MVNTIEVHAEEAVHSLEEGTKGSLSSKFWLRSFFFIYVEFIEMSKAVEHGKSARKMKWYIFAIVAVILIIVGIFVYVEVILPNQKK